MFKQAILLAFVLPMIPVWAAHKCTGPDGKVSYQDAPCTGKGEKFEAHPISVVAPAAVPIPSAQTNPTPSAVLVPPPAPTVAPPSSPLERESDVCLAWYKPKLRNPAGAYYTEPSKEGRVLSITIHATNGYGGYVIRRGSCEIHNGKLDSDWTKIHATRQGW